MNKTEILSSFVDDELDPTNAAEAVESIISDADKQADYRRYAMIGDVMRASTQAIADADFSDNIRKQISREATLMTFRPTLRSRYAKPAIGLAIAASVATLAIFGVKQTTPDSALPVSVAQIEQPVTLEVFDQPALAVNDIDLVKVPLDPRLSQYILKYSEQRASIGVSAVTPYARVVTFETH